MQNVRKIKARMVELGLTQKDVAEALSVAPATASQKINGTRPLYLHEAERLCQLLMIGSEEFGTYFFNHEIA